MIYDYQTIKNCGDLCLQAVSGKPWSVVLCLAERMLLSVNIHLLCLPRDCEGGNSYKSMDVPKEKDSVQSLAVVLLLSLVFIFS